MEPIKKILICEGHFFAWRKGDLHTQYGMIKENDLKKAKTTINSNIGKVFKILDPGFQDLLVRAKRGPQIILNKDIGMILTSTNVNKKSIVLEAGSGSGFSALHFSRFVKKVISYERREEFFNIAKENACLLNAKNIVFKQKDIYEGIDEKNVDLILLDLAEPGKAIEHSFSALKQGGYFVAYLPNITQVIEFIKEAEKKFFLIKVIELLEREWHIEEQRIRPASQMIGHTGFLCFLRKI